MFTKAVNKDIKDSAGMPITVSVVGPPFEDETTLGVMRVIDKHINFHNPPNVKL